MQITQSCMRRSRQTGIVLFIALIALVVMSLAAVALIRSVDTNTLIAGNLSFKQSALIATDIGVEAANDWLFDQSELSRTNLFNHNLGRGYYATYLDLDLDDPDVLRKDSTWNNSYTVDNVNGDKVRYIIQRMCNVTGEPNPIEDSCMTAQLNTDNDGEPCQSSSCIVGINVSPPLYRVTIRVDGPKNSVSYAQAYVF